MSLETLDREAGDDRNPDVATQRLQEMFDQPDAPEIIYASEYKAGIGDIVLRPAHSRYPRQLGGTALIRRAHLRPIQRGTLGAEHYLG